MNSSNLKKKRPSKSRRPKPKAPTNGEATAGGISLTVTGWAKEIGRDPKTIAVRLRDAGVAVLKDSLYPMRVVLAAVYGDEQQERLRGIQLDNQEKERMVAKAAGELVDRALAEKHIAEMFTLPLGQALAALPSVLDVQVNPGDPAMARAVLERHVEEIKKQIREGLPKGETK